MPGPHTPIADAPQWLLDWAIPERRRALRGRAARNGQATADDEWERLEAGVGEGERVTAMGRLVGRYGGRGWARAQTLERLQQWNGRNHPPIDAAEFEDQFRQMWERFTGRDVTQDMAAALAGEAQEVPAGPGRQAFIRQRLDEWVNRNLPPIVRETLRDALHQLGFRKGLFDQLFPLPRRQEQRDIEGSDQAARLIRLAQERMEWLFRDRMQNQAWIVYRDAQNRRVWWPLKSKPTERWLRLLFLHAEGRAVRQEVLMTAIETLAGIADEQLETVQLAPRAAFQNGYLWYDLMNGQAVRIWPGGWEIVDDVPVVFLRSSLQRAQPLPVRGGDIHEIFRVLNVTRPEDRELLCFYIVTSLLTHISRPVLALHGVEGAGKTLMQKCIANLLDPRTAPVMSPPDSLRDLVATAKDRMFVYLDNMRTMPSWLSDAACRLCTGEGDARRTLYSDADEFALEIRTLVGFNGIDQVASAPDLLDRALLIEIERREDFVPERALFRWFEEMRPRLLGAIFDILSRSPWPALDDDTVHMPFRLADWAEWCCLLAPALGTTREHFIAIYTRSLDVRHKEALAASVVAQAIRVHMDGLPVWEGYAAELYEALSGLAKEGGINTHSSVWPASAPLLARELNKIRTTLAATGIEITKRHRERGAYFSIRRVAAAAGEDGSL